MSRASALVVDDDPSTLDSFRELVQLEGFEAFAAGDLGTARRLLTEQPIDLVLCDLILPDGRGTDLLQELTTEAGTEFILITGNATLETAIEALRLGAYDYLTKPLDIARFKTLLNRFRRTRDLKREVRALRAELRRLGRFGEMVGTSEPMQRVYNLIERVAPTSASVLIVGESGTGKELVAQTVHKLSRRRNEMFLALNCGAIAQSLIESELFGHERGSFTGAERRHQGYFERASGGTLFLDEITEMPIELQVKLLRVLETGTVRRIGGVEEIAVDVRVIAATNRNPEEAVREGQLREDLLYRLKVFPIELPPLRRRGADIRQLALFFLDEMNRREETEKTFDQATLSKIEDYLWPGNVRELRNLVHRAFILADEEITPEAIPLDARTALPPSVGPHLQIRIGSSIAEVERRLILATMEEYAHSKKDVAEVLGISLKTLYNRLNAYAAVDARAAALQNG